MNKSNSYEVVSVINHNFHLTNNNQSLQTTRTIKRLGKLLLRFFAIVFSIAAFTFLPAQAQEQTIEDTSMSKGENRKSLIKMSRKS